ncbi:MAG: regulatory protein RecX [Ruminococcaceae bacterium]|nr:regulatory protein RecX [Oscillospiraceae bacterium]
MGKGITFEQAKEKAANILTYRDHSKASLYKRLLEKGVSEEIAEQTVDFFEDVGYINDERYAQDKARELYEVKKYGVRRVVFELTKRGVDKELAENVVFEICEENPNDLNSLISKYIKGQDISDFKVKKRISDKLIRMGYDFDEIKSAINNFSDEE